MTFCFEILVCWYLGFEGYGFCGVGFEFFGFCVLSFLGFLIFVVWVLVGDFGSLFFCFCFLNWDSGFLSSVFGVRFVF